MNLRNLDLNLLVAFEAVMAEANVTRAAARLGLSQPALSEALGRLRHVFDDELFVRTPQGMRPTRKAGELAEPIAAAMDILRAGLDAGASFDARQSRRVFRIGCGDYAEAVLLPLLLAHLHRSAPGIDLRMVASTPSLAPDLIDRGEIDAAIDVFPDALPKRFERIKLLDEHAVCVVRQGHRVVESGLDLAAYAAHAHAARSPVGETGRGLVDRALQQLGVHRRIAVTVSHVLALHAVVTGSDLIATQPSRIAQLFVQAGGVVLLHPPLDLRRWDVDLVHGRQAGRDAALQWLKRSVADVCATI